MPQLIDHIDKICRDKGRDVLYISFDRAVFDDYEWEDWKVRKDLIAWLQQNNIKNMPCGGVASEYGFKAYRGQLYIDIPYIENNPDYVKVKDYLENIDGSSRIPGVIFCYLPIESAMKNKHHDAPGFREKWADNF